ncbi:DUF3040 domain-containing protein [Streptomyces sp. NPDC002130]|uniref:DUF3040 domain-containing protein n=1 Tax=Streptomyces sp. NPDC002130 TaxID=3155568 RepID=UPI00331A1D58
MRAPSSRRRFQAAALFVLGLVLLIAGVALPLKPGGFPIISLFGFLFMFGAGVLRRPTYVYQRAPMMSESTRCTSKLPRPVICTQRQPLRLGELSRYSDRFDFVRTPRRPLTTRRSAFCSLSCLPMPLPPSWLRLWCAG